MLSLRQRVADRVAQRDPDRDALRRAVRAAVVVPAAGAVSFAVAGGSTQTPLFTIFGAVALLVFSDFPGNRQNRAVAYGGLGLNGFLLITLGTLVAPYPWPAVAAMFVIGVAVTFSGVLSETLAAGQRATLLTFVLPACTPPGPVAERLLGWTIALAVCVPAALFLLPPRHHGQLRRRAARACTALADRLDGKVTPDDVQRAMDALRKTFLGADFRPVGLTAGSRALVRVVDDLEWVADRTGRGTGVTLRDKDAVVRVLRASAAVLSISRPADREMARAELEGALLALRTLARGRWREDIDEILGAPDDEQAVAQGRDLLRRRTIAATVSATGRIIAAAAAADARPVWARALGLRLPPTGASDRLLPETVAAAKITTGFVGNRAVAVRNSLRTGLGLALAVTVTHLFPVEHGFWVVLGALSVLRSSALTTGTRVWRAVVGTGIGFLLGALLISLVGVDPVVMWILMPLAVFGSAYVPEIASFIAAQAAFTMMVLISFNLIAPTGWEVGLIRVEDVFVGALVGVAVSVLLWPRGATASVTRAIDSARFTAARYLRAAVLHITRGAYEERTNEVVTLSHAALDASRVVDDAVRQYLSESSGETDFRAPVVRSSNRATRLRGAADLIADIPTPPPLGTYPKVREVLEAHTDAICARVSGRSEPAAAWVPISEDFVRALRSEAREDTLGVAAALPLLTAAAALGELELIYPWNSSPP
ncbi:FUSC family protein [Mycolicibacterium gilvum]|uniref:Membrane protein-like protein n=1 Tax=Mycolicibacterium gilvum TaxID=1804 RepID=A0A378SFI3_9MYCO|nr:FUSC family protein [Mycolicibacterium gilvum]MCV7053703.1 FUSC family protein [Mycolicibacterium gilvum]STZ40898.1 Membrane protein-like protein [Mycolicibacterium gilvum]